jgi:hypothetical protein
MQKLTNQVRVYCSPTSSLLSAVEMFKGLLCLSGQWVQAYVDNDEVCFAGEQHPCVSGLRKIEDTVRGEMAAILTTLYISNQPYDFLLLLGVNVNQRYELPQQFRCLIPLHHPWAFCTIYFKLFFVDQPVLMWKIGRGNYESRPEMVPSLGPFFDVFA